MAGMFCRSFQSSDSVASGELEGHVETQIKWKPGQPIACLAARLKMPILHILLNAVLGMQGFDSGVATRPA